MAWESHYRKDNPNGLKATQGGSSAFRFSVNPWPNENDQLSRLTLNGSHTQKEFVQGQTIITDITVDNLDENAKERLVGQVYHPVTGEIVPGAKAYINADGKVVIEMPQGVVDENGKLNKNSIFYKDANYRGIQNLDVKFFARPRTAEEFKTLAETPDDYGETGTYTGSNAGTKTINHNGQEVTIDLQGIDRYDHYNLIGSFKLNLDDTRYYDQSFKDAEGKNTAKHVYSTVIPGQAFSVDMYIPDEMKKDGELDKTLHPNQKTKDEMETARDNQQVVAEVNWSFIHKENEGKKEEDQWKLIYDKDTLPTSFSVIAPKSAKPGDFVAVPLVYTYTNGSTDTHWFHFVVKESDNNRPVYQAEVGPQG